MGPRPAVDDVEWHPAVGEGAMDRVADVDPSGAARSAAVPQLRGEAPGERPDRGADVVEFARRGAGQLDVEGISGTPGLDRASHLVDRRVCQPGTDLVGDHRPQ